LTAVFLSFFHILQVCEISFFCIFFFLAVQARAGDALHHGGHGRGEDRQAAGEKGEGLSLERCCRARIVFFLPLNMKKKWKEKDKDLSTPYVHALTTTDTQELIFDGTVGRDADALGKLTPDDLKFLFS
jgi:hypothetical protein